MFGIGSVLFRCAIQSGMSSLHSVSEILTLFVDDVAAWTRSHDATAEVFWLEHGQRWLAIKGSPREASIMNVLRDWPKDRRAVTNMFGIIVLVATDRFDRQTMFWACFGRLWQNAQPSIATQQFPACSLLDLTVQCWGPGWRNFPMVRCKSDASVV